MKNPFVLKVFGAVVATLFCGFAPGAVLAAASDAPPVVQWPVRLRQDLDRGGQIEWRLRRAAGESCAVSTPDIGVVIDDPRDYAAADRPLLRQALAMDQDPVFAGVAMGSPAQQAGLQQGDTLMTINGRSARELGDSRDKGETASTAVARHLRTALADGATDLAIRRGEQSVALRIAPVVHCGIRVILQARQGIDAHSDGRNVAVSTGLVTFAQTDAQLALAIAHEFGHAIARHGKPKGLKERRRMEDEADLIGIRLTTCAGYDAEQAMVLFSRLGKRDVLSWLRAPTHRSFGARIDHMRRGLNGFVCGNDWLAGSL
ncbi:M48 family metalloprotease [Novosphingobium sp. SL115]|uniref:M48 family metalloprotease n=1 Tax=Novosphingobium sp. SL115 TaxID=2995150 RepID=UPI0022737711|nr:M48 family metalloprotease [Novosphingobium sp. SL115]MCY1670489.1 M48 family metalloprotease [Novosphingobium sp. SL115]